MTKDAPHTTIDNLWQDSLLHSTNLGYEMMLNPGPMYPTQYILKPGYFY